MPIKPTVESIILDPSSSYWIKDALDSALARDPVDAANDAEVLAAVLKDECDRKLAADLAALNGNQAGRKCIRCGYVINEHGGCGCMPPLDDKIV